ncbi:MAG: LysM peptidoglycan-binding domain-containing protein [Flavobacteriales bacterium]|nr:LysM peptidoglycan-binding domain-containing protein [Flavobacteriales bacterium]
MIGRTLTVLLSIFLCAQSVTGQPELYQNRLDNIGSRIKLTYNEPVKAVIDDYIAHEGRISEILGKSGYYLEVIEDTLKKYGLPTDLKFLAPALSGYDNWLVSDDGGSGFWQMRYIIARRYGLKVNSYVDERRDFLKATGAAARYLCDLKKSFPSWELAIAAFYSDEVEVNKAIRKAEGKQEYWSLHEYLPLRHQKAMPHFVAMAYMHFYHEAHKIPVKRYDPVDQVVVNVKQWSTVYQLSRALETDYEQLKELNPLFKKQVIPFTTVAYPVHIPKNKLQRFKDLGDSIYTYPKQEIEEGIVVPAKPIVPEPRVVEPANRSGSGNPGSGSDDNASGEKLVYYTVRSGDFLGKIADLYDVGLSDMKRWNNLRSDRINAGQKLKVYVPASKYSYYNSINSMTAAQKKQIINKD